MPRRFPFAAAGLALVLACAAGCGDAAPPPPKTGWVPGTLRLGHLADFRTLDPAVANDTDLIPFELVLFQPLLSYDADSTLVPLVAEDVPKLKRLEPTLAASALGLAGSPCAPGPLLTAAALFPGQIRNVYTFHLKKGVTFSNGREVTADDFVYAWTRLLNPKTKSPGASFIVDRIVGAHKFADGDADAVEGLRAVGRYDLEVELTQPDVTFLYVTAMPFLAPVPREEVEKENVPEEDRNDEFAIHPVGNGPFVLKEWRRGLRMRLERNPRYWGPQPGVDAIVMTFNLDDLTRQMMFERGELDLINQLPAPAYVHLRNDPKWKPYLEKLTVNGQFFLNLNCEMPPFDGPNGKRIRQAFNYAVNKDRLMQVTNGRFTPAAGVVPPQMPGYHSLVKGYPYDPKKAKQLLAEAGFPEGLPDPVDLWVPTERSDGISMAQVIQQDLAAIGVRVHLKIVAYDVFLPAASKRKNVAFSLAGWWEDYPDPSDFLDYLYTSRSIKDVESNNMAFYGSPEADRLIDEGDRELDPEKRVRLYEEAEKVVVDDAPVVPLVNGAEIWVRQPWVKGFAIHPVLLARYEEVSISPP